MPVDEMSARSAGRPAELHPPRALFRGKAWFWTPIVPLVALDLWSKAAAFAYVDGAAPRSARVDVDLLPDPFGFALVRYTNTGTIWGLAQDSTTPLMVLRCVAVVVILWFVARTARRIQLLVLGMILSGAIGNLYDNFFMPDRGVRDFLLFFMRGEGGRDHVFPAFNVADSCISVGAILLMLLLWREPAAPPSARGTNPAVPG